MGLFSFESKQVKEWKKLAKSGDMDAQYHLARACLIPQVYYT